MTTNHPIVATQSGERFCSRCQLTLPRAAFGAHHYCLGCAAQYKAERRERIKNQPIRYDLQKLRDRIRKRAERLRARTTRS